MKKLETKLPVEKLRDSLRKVGRYGVVIFLVVIVAIYGFVVLKINSLNNIQPTQSAVTAQNNPIRSAHIDTSVVQQLESLRDNSVNVQALFKQARNNPFQ
jgi:hypothetical protein